MVVAVSQHACMQCKQRPRQMPCGRDKANQQGVTCQKCCQPRDRHRDQPVTQIGGQSRRKQQPEVPVDPKTRIHSPTLRRGQGHVNRAQLQIVTKKP